MNHLSISLHRCARWALLSSLLVAAFCGAASAVPLQELADGNGIIVQGDKLFTNFDVVVTGFGSYTADPTLIDVKGITVGTDYGLRFDTPTGAPILSAGPNSYVDLLVSFDVVVLNPLFEIDTIGLSFSGYAPPEGFAQVVETARDGLTVVAQTSVQVPGGPTSVSLPLPDLYPLLHITKDMAALGGLTEGSYIVWVEQLFPEGPEQATLSFLALGFLVLLKPRKLARAMATVSTTVPVVGLLLMAAIFAAPAQVHAVPLQQLVDEDESILVIDKLFDNFSVSIEPDGNSAYIANPAAIDVAGIVIGDEIGIRFAGLLAARSNLVPNSGVTVTIGYDVTVIDPQLWIHDISLAFNGVATDPEGFARVTETVFDGNVPVGSAAVATPTPLSDHDLFDGMFKTLHVEKTIVLYGGAAGFTTISFIDQTFSQIPEPATVALLGLALPLLRLRRRSIGQA